MIMDFLGNHSTILLFFSIVAFLLSYAMPSNQKIPIQLALVSAIGGLLFVSGQISSNREWEEKMTKAKEQITKLEKSASEVSVKVVTEYVDRIKYIDRPSVHTIKEFITVENDKSCVVNKGFERAYDAAVNNATIKPEPSDSEPSDIVLSDIATLDSYNIKQFHKLKEQNESLKNWIREQEKLWNDYRSSSQLHSPSHSP